MSSRVTTHLGARRPASSCARARPTSRRLADHENPAEAAKTDTIAAQKRRGVHTHQTASQTLSNTMRCTVQIDRGALRTRAARGAAASIKCFLFQRSKAIDIHTFGVIRASKASCHSARRGGAAHMSCTRSARHPRSWSGTTSTSARPRPSIPEQIHSKPWPRSVT